MVNGNGGKLTLANAIITLFTAAILGVLAWGSHSVIELQKFAERGDRFTALQANDLRDEIITAWRAEHDREHVPKIRFMIAEEVAKANAPIVEALHALRLDALREGTPP